MMNTPDGYSARIRLNGITYSFRGELSCDSFKAKLTTNEGRIRLVIEPLRELIFEELTVSADINIERGQRIFMNGYQSWTDSREFEPHEKMRGLHGIPAAAVKKYSFDRYGDYGFVRYPNKAGEFHGFTYAYLKDGGDYLLFGSADESIGFTLIRLSVSGRRVSFSRECEGAVFSQKFTAVDIAVLQGTDSEVFDSWFGIMGITPPAAKPLRGYTSWYRHYQNISQEKLSHDLDAIVAGGAETDIFQIDDGYQTAVGDWLSVDDEKFPDGMAEMSRKIHENGLLSGLWLAPFVCEEDSEIFREHKGWLLRGSDGEPVRAGCNWSGSYALDFYNEEVRRYLRHVFSTVLGEWGFDLVKLDFLYAVCIIPQLGKSRGQVMNEAMDFLRECVGDKLILGCGVPLASAFGRADYCRIGCDVGLDWNDNPVMQMTHRERVSTKNSMLNSVFRRQLNGRAFLNDPDVFLLRDDGLKLTGCQKQALTVVNNLFGSVWFTSDDVSSYSEKAKRTRHSGELMRKAEVVSVDMCGGDVDIDIRLGGKPVGLTLTADGILKKRY